LLDTSLGTFSDRPGGAGRANCRASGWVPTLWGGRAIAWESENPAPLAGLQLLSLGKDKNRKRQVNL